MDGWPELEIRLISVQLELELGLGLSLAKDTFFIPGCTGFLTELGLFLRILDWTVNNAQIIEKEESDDGKKWSERIKFVGMESESSVK